MGKVLIMEITMSLDGYTTGPEVSAEEPLGRGGERLHEWMFHRGGRTTAATDGPCPVGPPEVPRQHRATASEHYVLGEQDRRTPVSV